jgi:O-antigen biosynthesis protein
VRVLFLIPSLPAAAPIAEYARRLDAVVATEPPAEEFDVAVATDWVTTARLFEVRATRHAFWVDHFAHRRMGTWQAERFAAQLAYDLPVDFVAAAPWVRDALADLRPEARTILVRTPAPGSPGTAPSSGGGGPLRVHLAGGGEEGGGDDERAALSAMEEPAEEAPLAAADVVVMLSAVDGVLGAPLEGFLSGATAVVGPAHDAQDLVVHGENGFVADADDVRGAARLLDRLARDRDLLARLQEAARATAARWPTWDDAAAQMAEALERIVAEDPPAQAQWPVRLMGDAIGGAAVFRQEIATLTAEVHRVRNEDAYRVAVQVRQRLSPLKRALRAAARRARGR